MTFRTTQKFVLLNKSLALCTFPLNRKTLYFLLQLSPQDHDYPTFSNYLLALKFYNTVYRVWGFDH